MQVGAALACRHCDRGFHALCLAAPVLDVADLDPCADWHCPACSKANQARSRFAVMYQNAAFWLWRTRTPTPTGSAMLLHCQCGEQHVAIILLASFNLNMLQRRCRLPQNCLSADSAA